MVDPFVVWIDSKEEKMIEDHERRYETMIWRQNKEGRTHIFLPRDHHLGVFMTLCARQRHCLLVVTWTMKGS
jgi:hypothetical protein